MTELVHRTDDRGVATIVLDSPTNRNALSRRLVDELYGHIHDACCSPDVRVIVLTGTGPVFCAGADLKERRQSDEPAQQNTMPDILALMMNSATPVVVKMNGPARAGGLGIIAASDIAIAPSSATFAFSEVRIGVAPAIIAVPCVRRMTPRSVSRYFLTGETFDAATAVDVGLITMAVDDVDDACADILTAFRLASPDAVATAKDLIDIARRLPIPDGLERMKVESAKYFRSPAAQEGMRAFTEKRPPSWARL